VGGSCKVSKKVSHIPAPLHSKYLIIWEPIKVVPLNPLIEEIRDLDNGAEQKEWDHIESLMERFCRENNLNNAVS